MPTTLFLLWLPAEQAAPPQTACEAALAAGIGLGSAEACQGDQARKAADTARGTAAKRARQLVDAVEQYGRAANLLTNPGANARLLAGLVRLFDPATLNRPADLEAVTRHLSALRCLSAWVRTCFERASYWAPHPAPPHPAPWHRT